MSLLAVKQHLQQVKMASLGRIAEYFQSDAELMRQMLGHWIRKGCVKQFTKTPGCGKQCGQCSVAEYEIYEWIERAH
jgi:putative ferrous iron transport protein C